MCLSLLLWGKVIVTSDNGSTQVSPAVGFNQPVSGPWHCSASSWHSGCVSLLPVLPKVTLNSSVQHQQQVLGAIERAKQVTAPELNSIIRVREAAVVWVGRGGKLCLGNGAGQDSHGLGLCP